MASTPRLHDATRPVFAGMPVWPGDACCRLAWTQRVAEGGMVNASELSMSVHTGTHADGPFHVLDGGIRIGAAPLEAYLGPARVLDARGLEAIEAGWLETRIGPDTPPRILVRTESWTSPHQFPTRFPALTPDAARLLVERRALLFGTDAPSPDPFDSGDLPAHRILLGAGMGILENLLLDGVAEGDYELIALPLKLVEADGSPVRAVLREAR